MNQTKNSASGRRLLNNLSPLTPTLKLNILPSVCIKHGWDFSDYITDAKSGGTLSTRWST